MVLTIKDKIGIHRWNKMRLWINSTLDKYEDYIWVAFMSLGFAIVLFIVVFMVGFILLTHMPPTLNDIFRFLGDGT